MKLNKSNKCLNFQKVLSGRTNPLKNSEGQCAELLEKWNGKIMYSFLLSPPPDNYLEGLQTSLAELKAKSDEEESKSCYFPSKIPNEKSKAKPSNP